MENPRPRLRKLSIKNFRCIGNTPVEIELDEIVVLVGPNNVGKSSILRAYEVAMEEASKTGHLTIHDFPNESIDPENLPEIIIETVIFDEGQPGKQWVLTDEKTEEKYVKEKWTWEAPGKPTRVGWDVKANDWHPTKRPWGAPNVAQAYRSEPHRVDAFSDPETQSKEIIKLLQSALTERVKALSEEELPDGELTPYQKLLHNVMELQKIVVKDTEQEIEAVQTEMKRMVSEVFPGYEVKFDAKPEDDVEKCINLFKNDPELRMGHEDGHQTSIEKQGSGARRTLLWSALRIISEQKRAKAGKGTERPHLLLLDEPELCLHPTAIREACKVLYDLPKSGNWQVMVTTHAPAFIDLSRDNTSIVRVERSGDGNIKGTTIFRPHRAKLDEDDKARLKLLNVFDPHVAEFFFGGKTVLVEGDTEYTAFKHVIAKHPEAFKDTHIVRARGKATLASLAKILNQFGAPYALLHDSDRPLCKAKEGKKPKANPAWGTNKNLLEVVGQAPDTAKVRLVASVPNLEEAYFGQEVTSEKPYSALQIISDENGQEFANLKKLLEALTDFTKPLPDNAVEWSEIADLEKALK
ncbi:ATP-dependent nuclease [Vibrio campbellii]|uniref:ATP-dependent nuclease n=1 Tax=Vibrio campbellii TaxID=680 RepID=UPI000CD34A68|nr:AAA family ATPase [Vibrio campbellii]AUW04160.1 ATP-dependent endonuclease [Vibrio campbellii]